MTALGFYHENSILLIIVTAAVPIVVLGVVGPDVLPGIVELLLVGLALALMSGGARHFVLAPLTRLLKSWLTHSFRVIYFRSFDEHHSYNARDNLGPILGCMGRLSTVHNPQYIQGLVPVEGHSEEEESWFAWLELGEILSDGLTAPKFADDEWKDGVQKLLRTSDLAVIDVTGGSNNVEWELGKARASLPPDRVILLRESDSDPGAVPEDAADAIVYDTSRRGRSKLRRALAARLSQISSARAPITQV